MKKKEKIASPLNILICIVDRGKGDKVTETLRMNGCSHNLITHGTGTAAKSSTGDFFGFGIIEREVVMSIVDASKINHVTDILTDMFDLNSPHTGILIALPLSSATSNLLDMMGINY
jgi:hypothetical protein